MKQAELKIVSYLRVSTVRQGESGLGLEAQRAAVNAYAARVGGRVIAEFEEVESGADNDRPKLAAAIACAKTRRARVVIADLTRLSRDASYLFGLRDAPVDIEAADGTTKADLIGWGFRAIQGQYERERIAERTRRALAAKRVELAAKGQRLGNPNGAAALRRAGKGNVASNAAQRARADAFALGLADDLKAAEAEGVSTLTGLAQWLTEQGIASPRGGEWGLSSVAALRQRVQTLTQATATQPTR